MRGPPGGAVRGRSDGRRGVAAADATDSGSLSRRRSTPPLPLPSQACWGTRAASERASMRAAPATAALEARQGRVRGPRRWSRGQRGGASGSIPRAVGVGRSRTAAAASGRCSPLAPPVFFPLFSRSGLRLPPSPSPVASAAKRDTGKRTRGSRSEPPTNAHVAESPFPAVGAAVAAVGWRRWRQRRWLAGRCSAAQLRVATGNGEKTTERWAEGR